MIRILYILGVTLLVFVVGFLGAVFGPGPGERANSYLMAVVDNRDRLAATQDADQRVVLVGGSSIGWGVSAKSLSIDLDMPVINLGVHAGIGYNNAWKLYAQDLHPDRDVIVLSPEYSMVRTGPDLTRTYCDVLFLTQAVNLDSLMCGARHLITVIQDVFSPVANDGDSLYQRDGFNDFGDYTLAYDLTNRGGFAGGETLDLQADAKAIATYQEFAAELTDAGFTVVYVPTTLAQKSCRETGAGYLRVNAALAQGLPTYFDDSFPYCLADENFVNTSYHPNRAGMVVKTDAMLAILTRHFAQ